MKNQVELCQTIFKRQNILCLGQQFLLLFLFLLCHHANNTKQLCGTWKLITLYFVCGIKCILVKNHFLQARFINEATHREYNITKINNVKLSIKTLPVDVMNSMNYHSSANDSKCFFIYSLCLSSNMLEVLQLSTYLWFLHANGYLMWQRGMFFLASQDPV